ncbi:MAG: hypothetical protein ACOY3O_14650 [Thermodesulfobacteriota bacterium]
MPDIAQQNRNLVLQAIIAAAVFIKFSKVRLELSPDGENFFPSGGFMLFARKFHMFLQVLETGTPDLGFRKGKIFDKPDQDAGVGTLQQLPQWILVFAFFLCAHVLLKRQK